MSGDEDNRDGRVIRCQLPLKVDPTHAWHAHIEDKAVGIEQAIGAQELFGGSKYHNPEPDRTDETAEGFANRFVIIDD
jgi:hypothetical protein